MTEGFFAALRMTEGFFAALRMTERFFAALRMTDCDDREILPLRQAQGKAFAKNDRGMPVIGDSSHKKSIKNSGQKL